MIKIATDNKQVNISPTLARKVQYQKQRHRYVPHNIRRGRYKGSKSKRNKRKNTSKRKKGKLKGIPKDLVNVWDSEYKWLPILDQDYSR